ncbi:MAG: long-chain-fatty-acid--CoA ligase [Dermatophilaceae bacterium]
MTVFPAASPRPGPHDRFYPPGVPRDVAIPDRSIWQTLDDNAAAYPDEVGMHFLGRSWTWAQLKADAETMAGALQSLGVRRGDRVLLYMQNCPQFVIAFHAIARADAIVVPANPMYRATEVAHYLEDAGVRVAFSSADIAEHLAEGADQTPEGLAHLVVFDLLEGLPDEVTEPAAQWPTAWREWLLTRAARPTLSRGRLHEWRDLAAAGHVPTGPAAARGEDVAVIGYTSGTTGVAKGCLLKHRSLVHQAVCAEYWMDQHHGDALLLVVPMFHVTGMIMGMLSAVQVAATIVLLPRWDRHVAARVIQEQRVTHWPNIPTMVIDLLSAPDLDDYDLSSLRYIGGGGVAMPEAIATRLREQFGLEYLEGYGLTESCAVATQNPFGGARRGYLGVPFLGVDVRVLDPETQTEAPVGEIGEFVVNGPNVFAGYWNRPKDTAEAFVELDGIPFFRTGDLGSVDADGYFKMTDRLKRMINASGFKVWPAEVEALMYGHPAVQEVCIVSAHDPYRGETVKAVIVPKEASRGSVTEADIIEWAKGSMAAFKYPRQVEFVEELPHSASGKLMWRLVQDAQDDREAKARADSGG